MNNQGGLLHTHDFLMVFLRSFLIHGVTWSPAEDISTLTTFFFFLHLFFIIIFCLLIHMCIHCLGHFPTPAPLPHSSSHPLLSFRQVPFCLYHWFCWRKDISITRRTKRFDSWVKIAIQRESIAFLCPCVTAQVDSAQLILTLVPDPLLMITCRFKVSVSVPLEWGHQTLSCFGFSACSCISHMCSPLVMWPKSNHTAAFALDLKSA
jgi:hypothetical protein